MLNPSENTFTSSSCNALLEEGYMVNEEEETNIDIDAIGFLCNEERTDEELNIVVEDYIFM